jgi:tetratricopeptide (TPR) repeat protein
MLEEHPTSDDLDKFLRSTSQSGSAVRNTRILRHLLVDCPVCRQHLCKMGWESSRLDQLMNIPSGEGAGERSECSYDSAFTKAERATAALLIREKPLAPPPEELFAELLSSSENQQIRRVSDDRRFAMPQMIKYLVDRSHAARYREPEVMLHLSRLAQLAAEGSSITETGSDLRLADLRTRAWGQLGNALRLNGHSRDAEEAFATAQGYRKQGTGDPALRAWLLEKITSLRIFQGQFDKAIALSEEAGQIYRDLGETHLLASTMVQKAIACLYSGETEGGVQTLNRALPLMDHEEDPHLLLAACHNLLRAYIDLGQPEQALLLYMEIRTLYQEFNDPMILLRASWQEGQLLRDLGHFQGAEATLLRARKGFLEKSLAYEVAAISLDLAFVYVKLGMVEEVKSTVVTAIPIFRSLGVSREILASLLQLQQVADQEHQALELIRALNARIQPLSKRMTGK